MKKHRRLDDHYKFEMTELLGNYVEVVSIKWVELWNLRFEDVHRRRKWEMFVNFLTGQDCRRIRGKTARHKRGWIERERRSKSKWKTDEVFYNWTPFVPTFRIPLPRYPLMDSHLTSLRSRYSIGFIIHGPLLNREYFLSAVPFFGRESGRRLFTRALFFMPYAEHSLHPVLSPSAHPLVLSQPRLSSLLSRLSLPLPSGPSPPRRLLAVFIAKQPPRSREILTFNFVSPFSGRFGPAFAVPRVSFV